jgi:hypothetical protein
MRRPAGRIIYRHSRPVGRYAVVPQTDTCCLLSLVKGSRVQSLQRSRRVIPASRAMRSSSDGQSHSRQSRHEVQRRRPVVVREGDLRGDVVLLDGCRRCGSCGRGTPCRGRTRSSPARSPAARRRAPAAGPRPAAAGGAAPTGTSAAHRPTLGASAPGSPCGPAAPRRPPTWSRAAAPPPGSSGSPGPPSRSSSTRPGTPSSSSTSTSSLVESICTSSPGRQAVSSPNGPSGRLASDRRVRAEPVVCRPWLSRSNSR